MNTTKVPVSTLATSDRHTLLIRIWSDTNDPFEYIRTTAAGAAAFNDRPELDALFLADDFPAILAAGATQTVKVTVCNEGDLSWSDAEGVSLQLVDTDPALS